MKRTEIMKAINEANTNKNIEWSIVKQTSTRIVLTNSYDECISYSIIIKHDVLDEWIEIRDNHIGSKIDSLVWDEDNWGDYTETRDGLKKAVQLAVRHFNHTY